MRRALGGRTDHGVYLTRNLLLPLAPVNSGGQLAGGWADTGGDPAPDGYAETNIDQTSTDFSNRVYEAFVNTGSGGEGSLHAAVPFPVDGARVTLSVQVDQVHGDGSQEVRIEALADDKSTVQASASTAVSSAGRKSVALTTPADTFFLKVYPARVTGVTAKNTKLQVSDPCLRRGGATAYVAK
jgi:hypothetical protein